MKEKESQEDRKLLRKRKISQESKRGSFIGSAERGYGKDGGLKGTKRQQGLVSPIKEKTIGGKGELRKNH